MSNESPRRLNRFLNAASLTPASAAIFVLASPLFKRFTSSASLGQFPRLAFLCMILTGRIAFAGGYQRICDRHAFNQVYNFEMNSLKTAATQRKDAAQRHG